MFANVLRTQARLSFTAGRTLATLPVSRAVAALPRIANASSMLRTISTSRPVWYENNAPRQSTGRTFKQYPESRFIFVGNLPFRATEEDLRDKLQVYGPIESVRIATGRDGRLRGFAHVHFENKEDAIALMESIAEEPMYLLDRDLRFSFAAPSRQERDPSNTLYFQQLHRTEEEIREIAGDFKDSIVSVRFLRARDTGEEYGAGFIEFNSIEKATEALSKLKGTDLGDQTLYLRYASHTAR
ncbi:hypothetical protein H0H92_015212 [Tricholoma furcatifolium]|nr:hypothetical protein H0H92_015212 [Tricholoma furcatifolium]